MEDTKLEKEDNKQQIKPPKRKRNKVWTCRKCLQEFENRKKLIKHSKTHLEPSKPNFQYNATLKVYACSSCSMHYQTEQEVKKHFEKAHEESYTCEVCQQISKKAYAFAIHMSSHSTNQTLECPLCNYATRRKPCLQNHINRIHYRKFYYTCTTCRKGFNDPVIFKEHHNEHVGVKPFKCVVCLKDFSYSRYMLTHQTRHHTVHIQGVTHKTQCPVCLKVFSKETTLTKHLSNKHSKDTNCDYKRHLCDVCGKSFASKDKMKLHYRIHTGEKPFQCRFCPKSFTKRDYLVMHERIHTGEKPYECTHCGRRFNQACSLKIHVRSHTGERPYVCPSCQKGCITRASLNVHMKYCCVDVVPTH